VIVHDVLEAHRRRFKGKSRDLALNNYYVYPSANSIGPTTDQAKWYDLANFQLACNGCQAGVIGELWVEYAFTMIRRKQPEFPVGGTAVHLQGIANATAASPLGLTPFSSNTVQSGSTLSKVNMAGDLSLYSGTTVGLNDGVDTAFNLPNVSATWLVQFYWVASAITTIPTTTASGGATKLTPYAGGGSGTGFFIAAGTNASITNVFTTTATAVPTATTNLITIGGLATMAGGIVDIYVSRLPTALVTFEERRVAGTEGRLEQLERMLSQLMASSSPETNARACLMAEERKSVTDGDTPDNSGDELGASVHIPRGVLSKFMRK